MPGALFQLISTGAQDIYIVGKPEITMFKTVYRRHQNFSLYDIIKIPKAKNTFGIDFQVELERAGDLLHKVYLVVELPEFNFRNPRPTCENIKKILLEYGIIWDTTERSSYNVVIDNCPEIVTLENYNNIIIEVINDWIRRYIDQYNYYSNGNIFSTNPIYLKSSSFEVMDRNLKGLFDWTLLFDDGSDNLAEWGDRIKNIYLDINKNSLTNGVAGSLMLSSKMLTKYAEDYSPIYSSKYNSSLLDSEYDVAIDAFGNDKRKILMYSNGFRNGYDNYNNTNLNIMFDTGALLQFLYNYYNDTAFNNINPITSKLSRSYLQLSKKNNFISNPLFGDILNRPPNTLSHEPVKFQLYDLNDFKNIIYLSLLFNLTKLKVRNFPGPFNFELDHGSLYVGNIRPPLRNPELIGIYNPYISLIDENVIYYHALDPTTTSYIINDSNKGINLSVYFNNIIQDFYKTFIDGYVEIFPFVNSVKFTTLDAYFITQKYFEQISTISSVTRDTNQVQEISQLILYYIQYNILYNLSMFRNMISVINNGKFYNDLHYRFTFYKEYRKSNDNIISVSSSTARSTFKNNYRNPYQNYNDNIGDNFENEIVNNLTYFGPLDDENSPSEIPTQTPSGENITNFFAKSISDAMGDFRNNCSNVLLNFEKLKYMDNFDIWKRCVFDLGNQIQTTYNSYTSESTQQLNPLFEVTDSFSEEYKRISVMNYIPFLAARDIPTMIYDIFRDSIAVQKIFEIIGNYSQFLITIDYRDAGDNGAPILGDEKKLIKDSIYEIMIDSVMGCGTNLSDKDHYDDIIKSGYSNTNNFLLVNTHRPENLLPEYTESNQLTKFLNKRNQNCEFKNILGDEYTYLPIEWLTQTYFKLFEEIIKNYFTNSNTQTTINIKTINDALTGVYQFNVSEAVNNQINIVDVLLFILKSTVNSYIMITPPISNNFPLYPRNSSPEAYNNYYLNNNNNTLSYVSNGYSMLALTTETGKEKRGLFYKNPITLASSARYCDATSTIWYQTQKNYIYYYNLMFNQTLISKPYYNSNIGIFMSSIFDYFKNTINGNRFTTFNYLDQNIINETPIKLGGGDIFGNSLSNSVNSITVVIYGLAFGNNELNNNFEERVMIKFKNKSKGDENFLILKNHNIDFDLRKTIEYSETINVPDNTDSFEVSYINNPGYQIYLTILVFLNNTTRYYQININEYENKILTTQNNLNLESEYIPPIDLNISNGFDFYRMRYLDNINKFTGKSKFNDLQDYINDNITLVNNDLKYYSDYANILKFVNDNTYIYNDGVINKNRNTPDYIYEQSEKILDVLNEHINIKYIQTLPLTNNYNDIITKENFINLENNDNYKGFHQIADLEPPIINEINTFSSEDIIGIGFNLPEIIQSDYGFGLSVGKYPYSRGYIQIKKTGGSYILSIYDFNTINDIQIDINPKEETTYFLIQYNKSQKLELYENDILIITITNSTKEYTNLLPKFYENCFLYISKAINIKIYDLYNAFYISTQYTNLIVASIIVNNITKWFYVGLTTDSILSLNPFTTFISDLENIEQILHTVYLENNNSVIIDKYKNTITTLTQEEHYFGQSSLTPTYLSSTDVFAFAFTNLNNNAQNLIIGISGQNESSEDIIIYIDNEQKKLVYRYNNNDTNSVDLRDLSLTNDNIFYFIYDNNSANSERLKIYCLNTNTKDVKLYSISNILLNFSAFKIINVILSGDVFVRFYMDRFAYNATDNNEIKNIMKNKLKWYYAGGTYSIPYSPELANITNIKFVSTYNSFENKNSFQNINADKNNFNDIIIASQEPNSNFSNSTLTFPIVDNSSMNDIDIIGFAFSVIDNTSEIIGIGLGTDGYFSNNYLAMIRDYNDYDNNFHRVELNFNNNNNNHNITYNKNPIFDKNNIYYCFQDNMNGTFTVYEDKSECPLIQITKEENSNYNNLLQVFKNNANLIVLGKTNIRFYTSKYVYTQASSSIQNIISSVTKWLYIGADDITPFNTENNESLINTSYILHTGYLENNIIERLDTKLYYDDQIFNINKIINPVVYRNTYNRAGINGDTTNLQNKTASIDYNTALYGILDSIYNNRLTGNMDTTFKSINIDLPNGKLFGDFITYQDNPFYSYSLYDCFLNLSSKVNYDGYNIKNSIVPPEPSNLITYGDLKYMSNIFDDTIHEETEIEHALQNLLYINQSSFIYQTIQLISSSNTSNVLISTNSPFEHIFYKPRVNISDATEKLTGNNIGIYPYGFSFVVNSIIDTENITEIGICINNNINNKIVIRKTDIFYDLYLQNGEDKLNFYFGSTSPINFSHSNLIYILINFNKKEDIGTIEIWQNNLVMIRKEINNISSCSLIDLFNNDNVNLYVNGNITINYLSYDRASKLASSDILNSNNFPSSPNEWLYPNQTSQNQQQIYSSFSYYKSDNSDNINSQNENYLNSVTINENNVLGDDDLITDYIFINVNNNTAVFSDNVINEKDIFGFAFEFISYKNIDDELITTPNNVSIGFGSINIPNQNRLQIRKIENDYYLIINDYQQKLSNIDFSDGNIYLIVQDNINKNLSICRYIYGSCNSPIVQITSKNKEYEKFISSVFNVNTNILISTNENTRIQFYTAKEIYNKSLLNNKIRIGNLTKWFYVGAKDITPIKKIVIDPDKIKHHQLTYGSTFGTFFDDRQVLPSDVLFNDSNSNDVILNDELNNENLDIKPYGIGIFELFGDSIDYQEDILTLKENLQYFTNIYGFAFSVVENKSDFAVGFYAWKCAYIVIYKSASKCQIIINYFDENANCLEKRINIVCPDFDKNKIYYVFQDNEKNTFQFYEENKLLFEVTGANYEFNRLLNGDFPVRYADGENKGSFLTYPGALKTVSTIGVGGLNNTTLRFYSQNYLNYVAPISIKNILNDDRIYWFGTSTKENLNVINTADYKTLSVSNSSVYLNPSIQITEKGILGFSFNIQNKQVEDFNSYGISIGFANVNNINTIYSELDTQTSFFELSFSNTGNFILFDAIYERTTFSLSFNQNDIYHIFQDNNEKNLSLYENNILVYRVSAIKNDPNYFEQYANIFEKFNNPFNIYLQGKADFRIFNAPYAYTNSTSEIKIFVDSCTDWVSFGGSNIGPIKKKTITSRNIYNDKNSHSLFNDPIKGTLSNFSLVSLYLYFQIIKKSQLNDYIDLSPFINLTVEQYQKISPSEYDDGAYTDTINALNEFTNNQIKKNFEAITKITNLQIGEKNLFINGFNVFLDNTYKTFPLSFNFNTTFTQRSPNFNYDIEFYNQSLNGRPNGIIDSDLESKLLKLIMNAPPYFSWCKELGHKIIKEVSISIDDQVIEKHTSDLLHLIYKQRIMPEQQRGYDKMIGNEFEMSQFTPVEGKFANSYGNGNPHWMSYYPSINKPVKKLYIPLYFWFCNNEGNALPIISLVHSRVMLNFKIEELNKLLYLEKDSYVYGTPEVKYSILSQYVYLEEDDRLRIARSKLEYLIEKYNYNGQEIISKDKYFELPLTKYPIESEQKTVPDYEQPIVIGLSNLTYRQHDFISNSSTIESQRSGELNFLEVITRSTGNHDFSPTFNFNGNRIFGFGFELISFPETNIISYDPPNVKNSNKLKTFTFGIGYKIEIYSLIGNKKITTSIKTIEFQKDNIVVKVRESISDDDFVIINNKKLGYKKELLLNYIKKPQFRGGGIDENQDLYLCYQNDNQEKIYFYENSILIAEINLNLPSTNTTIGLTSGFLNETIKKRNVSLYINGYVKVFYYNAKKIYNSYSFQIRDLMETLTDWLFVGAGDTTAITEKINYQNTHAQTPQNNSIDISSLGYKRIKINSDNTIKFNPSIKVSNNSFIAFAFSIENNIFLEDNYSFMIGLSANNNNNNKECIIALQKLKKNYVIFIDDGENSVSVPFFKNPVSHSVSVLPYKKFGNFENKKSNSKKQSNFRPEVIYTCLQDNISKTFTIFEDNEIIGQINTNYQNGNNYGNIYNNLCKKFNDNIHFYLKNIQSEKTIYVNYYTSQEIFTKHARLTLRRIVNNVTDWISLSKFKPSFYLPSFRNISTLIVDDVKGGGKITNQTQISSDVIMEKEKFQYILQPSIFTDVTKMIGFSFSLLGQDTEDFELGISAVNNVFKRIVIKKTGNNMVLQTHNINYVPLNFEKNIFPSSFAVKSTINQIISYNKRKNLLRSTKLTNEEKNLIRIRGFINDELERIGEIDNKFATTLRAAIYEYGTLIQKLNQVNSIIEQNEKNNTTNPDANSEKQELIKQINTIKNSSLYLANMQLLELNVQADNLQQRIRNEKLSVNIKSTITSCHNNPNKNICLDIKEYPLLQNLMFEEGSIYTIIQDNTLGTFTLFNNQEIIAQLTLADKSYTELLPEFRNGLNIFSCGKLNLRIYSPQYIYQTSTNLLKNYIDRVEQWIFVRKDIPEKTTQFTPYDPTTVKIRINMNDPVKYFIWYMKAYNEKTEQPMDFICWNRYGFNVRDENGNWINYKTCDFVKEMKLQMFGVDRERYREERYFNSVVPWGRNVHAQSFDEGEYMYSFALYPLMLQPSGAANYSEIDDSWMHINFTNEVESLIRDNKDIKIKFELWGKTINHLRICSGLGALLYQKE